MTFHKIAIPLKAYEPRTGRLVTDAKVEVGGASCPDSITRYVPFGLLNPGGEFAEDEYVTPSDADVRTAFASVITP